MENQSGKEPLKLYISFSHKDMAYRDQLLTHLAGLENIGLIKVWSDHLLDPGDDWEAVMRHELAQMDLWVVLISPDALNSKNIWGKEYPVAKQRAIPIIPILLRPSDLVGSAVEGLQLLPSWGKAISKWDNEDDAFLDITKGIRTVAQKRLDGAHKKPAIPPEPPLPKTSVPDKVDSSVPAPTGMPKTIKIFLASSAELRKDRDDFDLYFRQQNDHLMEEKGLYLRIVRWEDFLDAMSETRLQDEYNKEVCACDIFVSLFFTKTGKYTQEEFEVAHNQFSSTGKPQIFTFFKDEAIKPSLLEEYQTVKDFKKKLGDLGHFYTNYDNIEHLKRQFRDQLDKLLRAGKI